MEMQKFFSSFLATSRKSEAFATMKSHESLILGSSATLTYPTLSQEFMRCYGQL